VSTGGSRKVTGAIIEYSRRRMQPGTVACAPNSRPPAVVAIDEMPDGIAARCHNRSVFAADFAQSSHVPCRFLSEIAFHPSARRALAAPADYRVRKRRKDLCAAARHGWGDLGADRTGRPGVRISERKVQTWWTRSAYPPSLTGWYAGPRATPCRQSPRRRARRDMGADPRSGEIFRICPPPSKDGISSHREANQRGQDPFARGRIFIRDRLNRDAQLALELKHPRPAGRYSFRRGALCRTRDIGTVRRRGHAELETRRRS